MAGQGIANLCRPVLRVSLISDEPNWVDANATNLLSVVHPFYGVDCDPVDCSSSRGPVFASISTLLALSNS